MKSLIKLILITLIILTNNVIANNEVKIAFDTTCVKNKILVIPDGYSVISEIDTVSSLEFEGVLDSLFKKMNASQPLSDSESIILLKVLNTYLCSHSDGKNDFLKKFKSLYVLNEIYEEVYARYLGCKYSMYWGAGMSLYYKELEINLGGKPSLCARYFVTGKPVSYTHLTLPTKRIV